MNNTKIRSRTLKINNKKKKTTFTGDTTHFEANKKPDITLLYSFGIWLCPCLFISQYKTFVTCNKNGS